MLSVLLAACTLSLTAALCTANPDGSCVAPEAAVCVGTCYLRAFNTSCLAVPGCAWNETARCHPADSTIGAKCATQNISADCGAIAGCSWYSQQCPTVQACVPANGTYPSPCTDAGKNADNCAALGSQCQMGNRCLLAKYEECSLSSDQNSCTATAGCFWIRGAGKTASGTTNTTATCLPCLVDPGTSFYLTYLALVGKTCTSENATTNGIELSILQATPSATGCAGGQPAPSLGATLICSGAPGLTTSFAGVVVVAVFSLLLAF